MRVESFEISVPRERERPAAPTYAERYLDTDAGTAELAATDDEAALRRAAGRRPHRRHRAAQLGPAGALPA